MAEFQLQSTPTDSISSLCFSNDDPSLLLASSWDSTVRLYDVSSNTMKHSYSHHGAAVLSAVFTSDSTVASGGLDKKVKLVDLQTGSEEVIGSHDEAVKCLAFDSETRLLVSGSWDKSIQVFDTRSPEKAIGSCSHPYKVHSLDAVKGRLVVATADRRYFIYDLKNIQGGPVLLEERTGGLKFMTRSVRCMPNGEGYATSSIEGRVSVEFFDKSEASQVRKYAFKCHREKLPDGITEKVFPVNTLAFHPVHGTFVSGGSDGVVNLWDGFNKKRLRQYPKYPAGISALCFNKDGTMLAIGCSYQFEQGEKEDKPQDSIFIRPLGETETRPKIVASAN